MNTEMRKILIVDDESNVRLLFSTALARPGWIIATAADGESALGMIAKTSFDLILLDLQMPVVDGMEVLERLRMVGSDTPVVIVSARGVIPDVVHAIKLGAIDFIAKPVLPQTLRDVAAELLERHDTQLPLPRDGVQGPMTLCSELASNMKRAKRALNNRSFDEAEIFLKQAIGLDPNSAEAHNLLGIVHECRNEHDASYRQYKAALKANRRYKPAIHNMRRYYERFTFGNSEVPIDMGTA